MLTYILIGIAVQTIITFSRIVLGGMLSEHDYKMVFSNWVSALSFVLTFLIGAVVNVCLWPITIIYEVINIKNGI